MVAAFLAALATFDKLLLTLVTVALAGLVHAVAYTAAEGALRPQRLLLCRSADLLAIAAVLFVGRVWTAG